MRHTDLWNALREYHKSGIYPFHMPGHKQNPQIDYIPADIDITEIDGFDNLHHAEGILREAQIRAAELYGAEKSYFLVNGSTGGILSAISATVGNQGQILLARNSHKAAYHAVYLRGIQPIYLYPEMLESLGICGGISPETIRRTMEEYPQAEAVFVTSPTYEGMISNLPEIADIVHKKNKILIVDEAHGAHLGLADGFPGGAVAAGADIVIQSLHKTLPSMTQTAILHVQGTRVDRQRLEMFLQIYQTSSPSYVFMAGMDRCITLLTEHGAELFAVYRQRLDRFYREVSSLRQILVPTPSKVRGHAAVFDMDPSKVNCCIPSGKIAGSMLYDILREEYRLQPEMAAGSYVLAMTSIMDTQEGFDRLRDALHEIDRKLQAMQDEKTNALCKPIPQAGHLQADVVMTIAQADVQKSEEVSIWDAQGRVSLEYRYVYPPGVPVLVPGERITKEVLELLRAYEKSGLSVQGEYSTAGRIKVVL